MSSARPTSLFSSKLAVAMLTPLMPRRIIKVYEHKSYNYFTYVQESIHELSSFLSYNISSFTTTNLKGTNLPIPASPAVPPPTQHKTLPHALLHATATANNAIQATAPGPNDTLTKALALYAAAYERVALAHLDHDAAVQLNFLHPWQITLNTSIAIAIKARQAVRVSRLELDATKQMSVVPFLVVLTSAHPLPTTASRMLVIFKGLIVCRSLGIDPSFPISRLSFVKLFVGTPPPTQHKTLPHALLRTATTTSNAVQATTPSPDDALAKALALYTAAYERVALTRLNHDATIQLNFLHPWQTTLNTSIAITIKARQAVRVSRLELNAAKQTPAKQEHTRLKIENAEDNLVQKTEVAITLIKTVLENPKPIKNLNELAKAQLLYFSTTAEALSTVQDKIDELSVAAEGQYRSIQSPSFSNTPHSRRLESPTTTEVPL
ncbi:hypothetical protein C0989_005834 [Termitomyces sp. Mn162]|nr:hypothetical protein C0989_005834 [Termitomyces sp. Mn162]